MVSILKIKALCRFSRHLLGKFPTCHLEVKLKSKNPPHSHCARHTWLNFLKYVAESWVIEKGLSYHVSCLADWQSAKLKPLQSITWPTVLPEYSMMVTFFFNTSKANNHIKEETKVYFIIGQCSNTKTPHLQHPKNIRIKNVIIKQNV